MPIKCYWGLTCLATERNKKKADNDLQKHHHGGSCIIAHFDYTFGDGWLALVRVSRFPPLIHQIQPK